MIIRELDCTYLTVEFYKSFNGFMGKVFFEISEPLIIKFQYDDDENILEAVHEGEQLQFTFDNEYEFGGIFAHIKINKQIKNEEFEETKYQCVILSSMDKFVEWAIRDIIIEIHRQNNLNYIVEEVD